MLCPNCERRERATDAESGSPYLHCERCMMMTSTREHVHRYHYNDLQKKANHIPDDHPGWISRVIMYPVYSEGDAVIGYRCSEVGCDYVEHLRPLA